jgi:hypothetical protein
MVFEGTRVELCGQERRAGEDARKTQQRFSARDVVTPAIVERAQKSPPRDARAYVSLSGQAARGVLDRRKWLDHKWLTSSRSANLVTARVGAS